MTDAILQEIRTLKSVFESARDPEGRAFAPLADAYRRAGEIQAAVRLLNDGLARHPDFVPGHVVAARLYAEQGLAEEAAIAARNALKLDAENVSALGSLLRVLDAQDDPEAEAVRVQLLSLEPNFVQEEPEPTPLPGSQPAPETVMEEAEVETAESEVEAVTEEAPPPLQATAAMEAIDLESMPLDIESLSRGLGGAYVLDEEDESPAEETSPTLAAGFGSPDEEPVIELESLSPVGAEAEDVEVPTPLSDLSPVIDEMDVPGEEPVIDLESLSPVTEEVEDTEEVLALADLAPEVEARLPTEEPVIDLADLAPEAEAEPVMDLADLAPEAEAEPVMDLADLAPEAEEEAVMDLADLAPEAEEEPETGPPGAEEPAEITMLDLAEMTAEEEEEVVIDMDALGAGPGPEPVEAQEPEASTEPETDESADEAPASEPRDDESVGEPVYTRTLAELYVKQGALDQALTVYRHLAELDPSDAYIVRRIEELEAGLLRDDEGGKASAEEETETLARELATGGDGEHDVESPFVWSDEHEEAPEAEDSGPSIKDYFEGLLTWKPGERP